MPDPRTHSFIILTSFFKTKKSLPSIVSNYFDKHDLSSADRQRVFVLTRETVRWKGRLDMWIRSSLDRPLNKLSMKSKILLRCAVYELMLDNAVPDYAAINSWVEIAREKIGDRITGLINAVLRALNQKDSQKSPVCFDDLNSKAEWLSNPAWLLERWEKRYGQNQSTDLCHYNNINPHGTIRIDSHKTSIEETLSHLSNDGIDVEGIQGTSKFFRIQAGFGKLKQNELFLKGVCSIQDRAAGAAVEILNPQAGEIILDVCAAPGTKTLYCAKLMQGKGKIYASDINPERVKQGANDVNRHGLNSIVWEVKDATADKFPMADGILVDAPCTGTGVLARRPDIRWRRTASDVKEMCALQLAILNHISQFLKSTGRLVYSTCSLEPEENWQVVEAFLKLNSNFTLEKMKDVVPTEWIKDEKIMVTFPPRDNVDGMFGMCLRKK